MEWTTERRYRLYQDWTQEEIQHIKENMVQSPWHTHYHVEPKTGLLNDPNGFSYFDGKWIVFYQNFPFGAAHGLKSWVQLESEDLVHFTETGVKVLPDTPLDSTVPTLVLPCNLAITCSYFIQEMSAMKTGSVTLTRLVL